MNKLINFLERLAGIQSQLSVLILLIILFGDELMVFINFGG
jgi:hypothetical protein